MKTKNIAPKVGKGEALPKTTQAKPAQSVTLDFKRYGSLSKEYYFDFPENATDEEKTNIVNKMIFDTINAHGIDEFEGKKLYEIGSEKTLKEALLLIGNGIVSKDDYKGDKISKV